MPELWVCRPVRTPSLQPGRQLAVPAAARQGLLVSPVSVQRPMSGEWGGVMRRHSPGAGSPVFTLARSLKRAFQDVKRLRPMAVQDPANLVTTPLNLITREEIEKI